MSSFTLLIDTCVVLSTFPVHGAALLALPVNNTHNVPPVNWVDVMLTMPAGVTVPLTVVVQLIGLNAPFWSDVSPDAENGSPLGFIGRPSARETVTANAGAAETAVNATAATSNVIRRIFICKALSLDVWRPAPNRGRSVE
ncbi:hypothetical protein E2P84_07135 [Burkholderia cepacia]|uniref:Uncharacterized protein n=1 Tax=Burkholderia cepacia TaxID=292 RepID=A0AAX2RWM7_BURCE|nr:hypothetical protein E2P84_07135 [Burkholderia cepacia]TES99281.1 hypothetical protein E3D36_25715 [Burkholderia cepacia]TEU37117.1 hypothetical protein E3D39_25525 [Burkholderia cepacia]TEU48489.1 hypothetical protein E3D38_21880 [Burkholderia cepacia]TEU52574.1 hypothetical protein E3D37_04630 [Burkholderia cepacia]